GGAHTACCAAQRGAAASGGAEGCGGLRWEGWVVGCVRVYPPGADDDAQSFPGVGSDDGRDGEAAGGGGCAGRPSVGGGGWPHGSGCSAEVGRCGGPGGCRAVY